MPLTAKGSEILSRMQQEYDSSKGTSVFYASRNAGKISGVDGMSKKDEVFTDASATPEQKKLLDRLQEVQKSIQRGYGSPELTAERNKIKRELEKSGYGRKDADESSGEQQSEDDRMSSIETRLQDLERKCDAVEKRFGDRVVQAESGRRLEEKK
jgi:hypothetical protein